MPPGNTHEFGVGLFAEVSTEKMATNRPAHLRLEPPLVGQYVGAAAGVESLGHLGQASLDGRQVLMRVHLDVRLHDHHNSVHSAPEQDRRRRERRTSVFLLWRREAVG